MVAGLQGRITWWQTKKEWGVHKYWELTNEDRELLIGLSGCRRLTYYVSSILVKYKIYLHLNVLVVSKPPPTLLGEWVGFSKCVRFVLFICFSVLRCFFPFLPLFLPSHVTVSKLQKPDKAGSSHILPDPVLFVVVVCRRTSCTVNWISTCAINKVLIFSGAGSLYKYWQFSADLFGLSMPFGI